MSLRKREKMRKRQEANESTQLKIFQNQPVHLFFYSQFYNQEMEVSCLHLRKAYITENHQRELKPNSVLSVKTTYFEMN
jgi:hypothetical protein